MTAFGGVPRASVCPWALCVEAKTSPSSIAWQTPTATASWPIATWRKPGNSPARNRSSTFSSNRPISSISRRKSRSRSSDKARRFSTFATAWSVYFCVVQLAKAWDEVRDDWAEARIRVTLEEPERTERAAQLLAPLQPLIAGPGVLTFRVEHASDTVGRLLARMDAERIHGTLELAGSDPRPVQETPQVRPKLRAQWDVALGE